MTFAPKSIRSSCEPLEERLAREGVDAHGREVALGLLRLLLPLDDPVGLVEGQDPHPGRLRERDAPDGDRHVGTLAPVRRDERRVVHLVDVVAREDEDRLRVRVLQDAAVAEDRVGRPAVPLRDATPGDVGLEELDAPLRPIEVPRPPHADVVVERSRVVLGEDDDVVDVGVHAVREREVDDPVLPAERDGRLRPHGREDGEPLALAAGEDHRHRPLHWDPPRGSAGGVTGLDASTAPKPRGIGAA